MRRRKGGNKPSQQHQKVNRYIIIEGREMRSGEFCSILFIVCTCMLWLYYIVRCDLLAVSSLTSLIHVKITPLIPKACTVIDGLLSSIFREMNRPTEKNERRYVLFDGDVDALWIENMNSLLDDNKLLTLANGERIRLQVMPCFV